MATEILTPNGDVAGASDWVKTGSPPDSDDASYTEIDEGIAGDADTTYVEQPNNTPTFSETINFHFSDPVGSADVGSGADSWTLRTRAKYTGADAPVFSFALYQGASTLIAGPSSPTLTGAYGEHTLTFDPAAITDVNDLRLRLTGSASFGGSAPRVTAADLLIQLVSTPVYDQDGFRGRNDDGSETTATWKAAAGADFDQEADEKFRLRFLIQTTIAGAAGFKPTIYYRKNSGAGYGAWAAVPATFILGSTVVARANSLNLTHGADTTQQLGAGTFISDNNGVIELGALNTLTTEVNKEWEVEVVLYFSRTLNNPGDLFQFKVTNDGVDLDTYTDTPVVTIVATPAPFTDQPGGINGTLKFLLHLGG